MVRDRRARHYRGRRSATSPSRTASASSAFSLDRRWRAHPAPRRCSTTSSCRSGYKARFDVSAVRSRRRPKVPAAFVHADQFAAYSDGRVLLVAAERPPPDDPMTPGPAFVLDFGASGVEAPKRIELPRVKLSRSYVSAGRSLDDLIVYERGDPPTEARLLVLEGDAFVPIPLVLDMPLPSRPLAGDDGKPMEHHGYYGRGAATPPALPRHLTGKRPPRRIRLPPASSLACAELEPQEGSRYGERSVAYASPAAAPRARVLTPQSSVGTAGVYISNTTASSATPGPSPLRLRAGCDPVLSPRLASTLDEASVLEAARTLGDVPENRRCSRKTRRRAGLGDRSGSTKIQDAGRGARRVNKQIPLAKSSARLLWTAPCHLRRNESADVAGYRLRPSHAQHDKAPMELDRRVTRKTPEDPLHGDSLPAEGVEPVAWTFRPCEEGERGASVAERRPWKGPRWLRSPRARADGRRPWLKGRKLREAAGVEAGTSLLGDRAGGRGAGAQGAGRSAEGARGCAPEGAGGVVGHHAHRAARLDLLDRLGQAGRDSRASDHDGVLDARRGQATRVLLRSLRDVREEPQQPDRRRQLGFGSSCSRSHHRRRRDRPWRPRDRADVAVEAVRHLLRRHGGVSEMPAVDGAHGRIPPRTRRTARVTAATEIGSERGPPLV